MLVTRHYPDLGSASDWSCCEGNLLQPIRNTTQIWVVTRHQYGISALVSLTSFLGETDGGVAKCRLFSQAMATCKFLFQEGVVQPRPQALLFSHGRGERETRVTGNEPQGTMGRVQTAGEATSRPFSPSRLPLRAHRKRDVWVRGRGWYIIVGGQAVFK